MPVKVFPLGLAIVVLLFCAAAEAVILDVDLEFDGYGNAALWQWDFFPAESTLIIDQDTDFGPTQTNLAVALYGDSTLHVIKYVRNTSELNWTGYKFALKGDKVFFLDNLSVASSFNFDPLSEGFQEVDITENMITFSNPGMLPLHPGDFVAFKFDLYILNPEPATVLMLGLGAFILRLKKQKTS